MTTLDPNQEPVNNEKEGCGCNFISRITSPLWDVIKLSPIGGLYKLMSFPGGNAVASGIIFLSLLVLLVFISPLELLFIVLIVIIANFLWAAVTAVRTNSTRRKQLVTNSIRIAVFVSVILVIAFFILNWSEMRDLFETFRDWITLQSAPHLEATFD